MSEGRPFRDLLHITRESKKLLILILILFSLGVGGIYYGVTVETKLAWLPEVLRALGSTFLLAALIGIVYELGMRKTALKEMEKIVQDNTPNIGEVSEIVTTVRALDNKLSLLTQSTDLDDALKALGIQYVFTSRSGTSPFLHNILDNALIKLKDKEDVSIDLMGYGLTSFFDQIGLYHNRMVQIANVFEDSPQDIKSRMRVVFPHPESITVVERANAQIKGRPTVKLPYPSKEDVDEYVRKIIRLSSTSEAHYYLQLINSMDIRTRLYKDIYQLGVGFFKERTIAEFKGSNRGICVRFTRLNPAFQYVRIDNFLIIEPYHFGVESLISTGECLSTPEKGSMVLCFDLNNKSNYADKMLNHFEYIWQHPDATVDWNEIMQAFLSDIE